MTHSLAHTLVHAIVHALVRGAVHQGHRKLIHTRPVVHVHVTRAARVVQPPALPPPLPAAVSLQQARPARRRRSSVQTRPTHC